MKRILALSIMLFLLGSAYAQTNCGARYQQLMEEAEKAFKDQDYRNAYEKYRAARGCKLADLAHIDRQMDASMDGIDQQRSDAQKKEEQARAATEAALRAKNQEVLAKKGLEEAKKDLEDALADAEKAKKKAEDEKERADKLAAEIQQKFEELKSANTEKIASMLLQGKRYLQKMAYDSAFIICQTIHNIPGGRENARRFISELLYFYSESGQFEKAAELLSMAGQGSIHANRGSITELLKGWNSGFFDTLTLRYYPEMIHVEKGFFLMGADLDRDGKIDEDAPLHYEAVNSFGLGRTEITNRQYAVYAARNKIGYSQNLGETPVAEVSWLDAISYLNWLSTQMEKEPYYEFRDSTVQPNSKKITVVNIRKKSDGYRLPTETEWEYAARGGQNLEQKRYPGSRNPYEVAWEKGRTTTTQPVGSLKPNTLGLYDMSGNVAEYCWDIYVPINPKNASYQMSINVNNYHPLELRINRGSNFSERSRFPELAKRDHLDHNHKSPNAGFRAAISKKLAQ